MSAVFTPGPTVGALMIGSIVGATLYGLTCSQGYMYYGRGQRDHWATRYYMLMLWLINSVNVFLLGHIVYYYFITRYGDTTAFLTPVWSLVTLVLLTAIVSFMVRGLYIKGIWHLSHQNPMMTAALTALSVFNLVCGVILTVKGFRIVAGEFESLKAALILNLASALLADVAVTVSLLYLMRANTSGNPRRETISNRLVLYVVNTGLLTVADGTVALITYAVMPDTFIFLTPYMVLSHLYTNALFASLNARTLGSSGEQIVSMNLSTVSPPRFPGSSFSTGPRSSQQLGMPMQTVVQTRPEESGSDNEDVKHYSLAKA
ncbi:hypothetical protein BV20DRAFT_964531 [Pilatotrama ljubarskyi]|nr:hypothetical protein BV20DRAFT_964531 [Pilatotrama ljubarskyi]